MALSPPSDSAQAAQQALPVEELRRRARRRVAGALALVVLAVASVPLVFDAEPRPMPDDIPIDLPGNAPAAQETTPSPPAPEDWIGEAMVEPPDAFVPEPPDQPAYVGPSLPAEPFASATAPPQVPPPVQIAPIPVPLPGPRAHPQTQVAAVQPQATPAVPPPAAPLPAPPAASAAPTVAAPAPTPPKPAPPQPKPPTTPNKPAASTSPKPKPPAAPPAAAAKPRDAVNPQRAARARDLLEGRTLAAVQPPAPGKPAGSKTDEQARGFVVQVGAFADSAKAAQVRARLQLAGFKTFTERVTRSGQPVTRVRLGTFSSRQEAERMAERVKAQGLPATVMPL